MAELNISAQDAMAGVQSITQQGPKLKPTGIFVLDRSLGGGLPERSLVYFSADSRSMSEVFLYQFTQSRKTYYFTTSRRPKFIQKDIENLNFDISNISFVDIYSEYYLTQFGEMVDTIGNEYADAKIIEFTEYNLMNIMNESMNEDVNIIIDNFSFYMNLNVNLGMLKRLTNILYETTKEMDCLTYLYGLKGSHPEKVENDILNTADVIFDVTLELSADSMTSMLAIPKIRGMVPNSEIIKFKVGDGVQIDTSKDIA
ncbi:MAG: recombinase RecA [Methanosarcinaceae archaeon]|nr:recombinase RecA [Methanosarcinaceae archaeon]